jgi:excisionase family DNA binding protein
MGEDMKSVTQAAEYLGVSARRVRRLCVEGRVHGAEKCGRAWVLPDSIIVLPAGRVRPGKIEFSEAKP